MSPIIPFSSGFSGIPITAWDSLEVTYITKRTDLPKRGMHGNVSGVFFSSDSFTFRFSNDISLIVPVLGGSMSEFTDLQREQIDFLNRILLEEKKANLHLASVSGEDIEDDSVEED